MSFDVLIRGGEIIDGTGAPARCADVGLLGDHVAAIGVLAAAAARTVINATGLTMAPGFIDIHTHSDFTLLVDGRADSALCQGITTEVVGQCGFSAAPLGSPPDASQMLGHVDTGVALNWRTFAEYLQQLEAARPAVNVAALVGHGALVRAAGSGGLPALRQFTEEAFDAGAYGLSTGLEYWPGNEAPAHEIEALAALTGHRRRI